MRIPLALKRSLAPAFHGLSYVTGRSTRSARALPLRWIIATHGVGRGDGSGARFRALMAFLAANFRIISLSELVRGLDRSSALTRPEVVLTFDDGLRNNFTVAYPILKEMALPATFFVCPGLIEQRQWLWNHEARLRLLSMRVDRRKALAAAASCADVGPDRIIEWMKTLPYSQRAEFEEVLRRDTPGFRPTAEEHRRFDLMTWEELALLDPALITIGAHTVNHCILTSLSATEIEHEVRESRNRLERRLRRPIEHFAYPNGIFDQRARRVVEGSFQSAVGTTRGSVSPGADRFDLRRMSLPSSVPALAWHLSHRVDDV